MCYTDLQTHEPSKNTFLGFHHKKILLNFTTMKASRHMQTNISGRHLPTLGVSLICGIKLSDIKQTLQMNIFLHLESTNCLENIPIL